MKEIGLMDTLMEMAMLYMPMEIFMKVNFLMELDRVKENTFLVA